MKKIILILLLCISYNTTAMTFSETEISCPIGGEKFTFKEPRSGTSFGQTLDFMPIGAIVSPWPLAKCPSNGLIIYPELSQENYAQLKSFVLSKNYQTLQKKESNYYLLYTLFKKLNVDSELLINTLLAATWEVEADQYEHYAKELKILLNQPQDSNNFNFIYPLISIELSRRMGDFKTAENELQRYTRVHLDKVSSAQIDFVQQYLEQQNNFIKLQNKDVQQFNIPNQENE